MAEKINTLNFSHLFIFTLILFSFAIYNSNVIFLTFDEYGQGLESFDSSDNYLAFLYQIFLLGCAFLYLKFINFDFSQWLIKFNVSSVICGILIFALIGFLSDIYFYIFDLLFGNQIFWQSKSDDTIGFDLILYACLNGVYEELFFLGICLHVKVKNIIKAFIFSLIIRFLFHTYQSFFVAFGITMVVGGVFYLLYVKFNLKNLLPFFIAHGLADVFGLSFLGSFCE